MLGVFLSWFDGNTPVLPIVSLLGVFRGSIFPASWLIAVFNDGSLLLPPAFAVFVDCFGVNMISRDGCLRFGIGGGERGNVFFWKIGCTFAQDLGVLQKLKNISKNKKRTRSVSLSFGVFCKLSMADFGAGWKLIEMNENTRVNIQTSSIVPSVIVFDLRVSSSENWFRLFARNRQTLHQSLSFCLPNTYFTPACVRVHLIPTSYGFADLHNPPQYLLPVYLTTRATKLLVAENWSVWQLNNNRVLILTSHRVINTFNIRWWKCDIFWISIIFFSWFCFLWNNEFWRDRYRERHTFLSICRVVHIDRTQMIRMTDLFADFDWKENLQRLKLVKLNNFLWKLFYHNLGHWPKPIFSKNNLIECLFLYRNIIEVRNYSLFVSFSSFDLRVVIVLQRLFGYLQ